jgi:hypothetical protein
MRELDDILKDVVPLIRPLLTEAFEAGRARGREEGERSLRAALAVVLDAPGTLSEATAAHEIRPAVPKTVSHRAPPGSVKPLLLDMIQKNPGISTAQMQESSGAKPNSVRGTLYALQSEGLITRDKDGWHAVQKEDPPALVQQPPVWVQQPSPLFSGRTVEEIFGAPLNRKT